MSDSMRWQTTRAGWAPRRQHHVDQASHAVADRDALAELLGERLQEHEFGDLDVTVRKWVDEEDPGYVQLTGFDLLHIDAIELRNLIRDCSTQARDRDRGGEGGRAATT
jgi:hypothetical protein